MGTAAVDAAWLQPLGMHGYSLWGYMGRAAARTLSRHSSHSCGTPGWSGSGGSRQSAAGGAAEAVAVAGGIVLEVVEVRVLDEPEAVQVGDEDRSADDPGAGRREAYGRDPQDWEGGRPDQRREELPLNTELSAVPRGDAATLLRHPLLHRRPRRSLASGSSANLPRGKEVAGRLDSITASIRLYC